MDHEYVTVIDIWKSPVYGELVVVLAQTSDHIHSSVLRSVFLAQNGDVMVCAVHGRPDEVTCSGIKPDIFLINMFETAH